MSDGRVYAALVAFPQKHLNDGEELVLDLRPHWLYLAPATFFLLVAIVLGILAAVKVDGDAGTAASIAALVLLVVAAVLFFVYRYANWVTTISCSPPTG